MAAATGMLLFGMGVVLVNGWLTPMALAVLAVVGIAVFALTRSATDVGVFVAPLLAVGLLLARPYWQFTVFMVGLTAFIWLTQLGIARRKHLFRLSESARTRAVKLHLRAH